MPTTTMNWSEVLLYVIESLLGLIVSVGIPYLFVFIKKYFNTKTRSDLVEKYLDLAEKLVKDAVSQVQQTYVSTLKKTGNFDKAAQEEAFRMAKNAVIAMMNEEMKEIVIEAVGDFDIYINTMIESAVHEGKMEEAYLNK